MKHVYGSHIRLIAAAHMLVRRLLLLFLGLLVASCDSGDGLVRTGNDASLSSLSFSGVTLDPEFSPSETDYTAAVRFPFKSTLVTATTTDVNSSVSVNGNLVASGSASDPIALDEGGNTVSVNVTAEDKSTTQTYTIAVDRQSASEFAQKTYLKVITRDVENWFGFQLALSADGQTLAAGDPLEWGGATGVNGDETDLSADSAGAAYVFTRDSAGQWIQQAYVKASNTDADDWFGYSVALSADGSTLAASAMLEGSAATGVNGDQSNNDAPQSGAVYVYVRDGAGIWTQQAYLKASNTDSFDNFGRYVALSDDGATLAVVADSEASAATGVNGDETDNTAPYSGAVYIFTRHSGGVWTQQVYIKASGTGSDFALRGPIGLSDDGTTLAVIGSHSGTNVAYIFSRDSGSTWNQQTHLMPSNSEDGFYVPRVVLSGDGATLAMGRSWDDSAATGVNGDETDNSAWSSGAVYVFKRDSLDAWTQQAYVKASNTDAGDQFGAFIALSADGAMLVVGAPSEDSAATGINGDDSDNSAQNSGAVFVFTRDSHEVWRQRAYLKTSSGEPLQFLGSGLALSADGTILAANAEGDPGAVYFFEL